MVAFMRGSRTQASPPLQASPPPLKMAGRATKENDLHLIRVGNERYEIPDAVVLGG